MRYVVDASVGLKWVMNEIDAPIALRIREEFRQAVHELIAPDVFVLEVAHGLAKAERIHHVAGVACLRAASTESREPHPR